MKRLLLIPLVLFLACEDKKEDIHGCLDSQACNYDSEATIDNNNCEFAEVYHNCAGECFTEFDEDNDGICDWNDGDSYSTVQIGNQLWMAENLKVTHYNNGDKIPTDYSNDEWLNLSTGAYAVYNDDPSNAETYGNLYNWYSVDDERGICPAGWHVPTEEEYTSLTDYLGGTSVAGGKMKECTEGSCPESEYWYSPNAGATNESGFTGLPGGHRNNVEGDYHWIGYNAYLWSSTDYNNYATWYRRLYNMNSEIERALFYKSYGLSVRCIKD